MEREQKGYYLANDNDISNIDYYIATFSGVNQMLKTFLDNEPKTRTAILTASYRDILTLRVLAHQTAVYMQELEKRKTFQATGAEALEAAGQTPPTII